MLVLTRRPGESLLIGPDVVLTVLEVDGDRIKIGISAPRSVTILRQELSDAIKSENLQAASSHGLVGVTQKFTLARPGGKS
jgi:carbon storage regulator